MSKRLDALSAQLNAPLLVTNLTNIYYLTGFDSSNAALLVKPGGGATLYTDFRYAEVARAVPDVDVQVTKRSMMADIGGRLKGRVQFEADVLPYVEWERLSSGSAKLVPTHGLVDSVRAIKDDEEIAKIRKAARIADRGFEALTAETFVGRSEKEIAWRLRELLHAHGADELAFETIVRATDLAERRLSSLAFERAKIVHLCSVPHSVAEVSAKLHIPLGVAQVLAGDMVGDGLLTMSQSIGSPADDVSLLKRLINGVRVL